MESSARMTNRTSVAAVQLTCGPDPRDNLKRTLSSISTAAEQGAQLICLQELFQHQYFCQREDHAQFALAEQIDSDTQQQLVRAAGHLGVVILWPFFERRAAGVYHNSALLIEPDGRLLGPYRKMHIPDDPHYYEKFYFAPGDTGFACWPTTVGHVGICICWDQWFPEAARLTALQGAQLLLYPTAIGWLDEDKQAGLDDSQVDAWQTMMRSHAIANGVFVIAANRVGREQDIEFWGNSFICDPYGNVLAEASRCEEQVLVAECDLSLVETARTHWPFFRDRRVDAYGGLLQRWSQEQ